MKRKRSALLTPFVTSAVICLMIVVGSLAKSLWGFAHGNLLALGGVMAAVLCGAAHMLYCAARRPQEEQEPVAAPAPECAVPAVQLCSKPLVRRDPRAGRCVSFGRKPRRKTG